VLVSMEALSWIGGKRGGRRMGRMEMGYVQKIMCWGEGRESNIVRECVISYCGSLDMVYRGSFKENYMEKD
jgi:hypothetical protein